MQTDPTVLSLRPGGGGGGGSRSSRFRFDSPALAGGGGGSSVDISSLRPHGGAGGSSYKAGDSPFESHECIRYTRDQLLQLREREAVDIPEDILKVKQEIEVEFYGEDRNWVRSDANLPSQSQSRNFEPDSRDWRARSAQIPTAAENTWDTNKEGYVSNSRQQDINQFNRHDQGRNISANHGIGVMSKSEAIQMAEGAELLLAILSVDADPPVLRLFDSGEYKKHKYEQQKKKRVQQKRSAASRVDIKELKMGYNIDSHDYSVRLRAAQRFLKDGDKVKIIVNLKGRENEFRNIAIELIKRFQNEVGEVNGVRNRFEMTLCSFGVHALGESINCLRKLATEESKNFNDRNIFIIMTPNKAVLQKTQEQLKKKETSKEVSAGV